MTRRLLLVLLLSLAPGFAWQIEGDHFVDGGGPVAIRGLWYPLSARRDGRALDAAGLVDKVLGSGLNLLCVDALEGPTLSDCDAVLAAAAAKHLAVAVRPLPEDQPAAVARLVARLGSATALVAWLSAAPSAALTGRPVLRLGSRLVGSTAPVVDTTPALYTGGGYGSWARQLPRGGAWLATVEAAPPADLVRRQVLLSAAAQPDLYAAGWLRPETVAEQAGEYLLVPEPAQLRLQAYAAVGRGARGWIVDHAGHLAIGPDPYNGVDRAAEVIQLAQELRWFERFVAAGQVQPAPVTPAGVAAGLLRAGDDWLLLLWRDQRQDTRCVGGATSGPFTVDLPLPVRDGLRLWTVGRDEVTAQPVDVRDDGVRVSVPDLDLTAAYVVSAAPQTALAAAVAAELPATARRALGLAQRRWTKVAHTAAELEKLRPGTAARAWLGPASDRLVDAAQAVSYGYWRSGLQAAEEAERLCRLAQSHELTTALTAAGPPAEPPVTFAALPSWYAHRRPVPTEPYTWSAAQPLRLDFADVATGRTPPRWTALPGFDQTVATLTAIRAAGGPAVRWLPRGSDPGALYLPFTPASALTVTVTIGLTRAPAGDRLILLAPGPWQSPTGGVVIHADGTVTSYAGSPAVRLAGPGRVVLTLTLAAGRLTVRWGDQLLAEAPLSGPAGALVLAKRGGVDDVALDLGPLTVQAP